MLIVRHPWKTIYRGNLTFMVLSNNGIASPFLDTHLLAGNLWTAINADSILEYST